MDGERLVCPRCRQKTREPGQAVCKWCRRTLLFDRQEREMRRRGPRKPPAA